MSADVLEQSATVGWPDFEAIGMNHRRLSYWVSAGYLHPIGDPNPGTGNPLRFPPAELDVARWILTLTTWGLELAAAADYARDPWLRENLARILLTDATPTPPLTAAPSAPEGAGDAGPPTSPA